MQRCPTCDFVYEEGQRYCDMDGTVLVHDPNELPRNKPFPRPRVRPFFRLLAIVVIPNTLLGALLFYGTSQPAAQSTTPISVAPIMSQGNAPAAVTAEPTVIESVSSPSNEGPAPSNEGTPETSTSSSSTTEHPSQIDPASKTEPTKRSVNRSDGAPLDLPAQPPMARRTTAKPGAQNTPSKQDSKIESFMKKTGRILKRPFKF